MTQSVQLGKVPSATIRLFSWTPGRIIAAPRLRRNSMKFIFGAREHRGAEVVNARGDAGLKIAHQKGGYSMTRLNPAVNGAESDAALDPKVLETIGQALKAHYDDLVSAPLPQKFLDLLAKLEEEERHGEAEGNPNANG